MMAVNGAERPEMQKIERAGDENETQVPRRLRTAGAFRLRRGRAMVLRRASARTRAFRIAVGDAAARELGLTEQQRAHHSGFLS